MLVGFPPFHEHCALAFLFAGLASAGLFFVRARTD
jgi:hypothetical protein